MWKALWKCRGWLRLPRSSIQKERNAREIERLRTSGTVIGESLHAGRVRIFDNCFVGANAVVCRDLPPGSVVAGNPAVVARFDDWLTRKE